MSRIRSVLALESHVRQVPGAVVLGVRPNFLDYSAREQEAIRQAETIYYPGTRYADVFAAMGKRTFPSAHSYRFAQDKILQTALFQTAGIAHPRTRVFFGPRQKAQIESYFQFPMVAKVPRGSSLGSGVFLIRDRVQLAAYCCSPFPAYIQEYLPDRREARVVVIGGRIALAYWRTPGADGFRANLALGGTASFTPMAEPILSLARNVAHRCHWDDVGLDLCLVNGEAVVLEANMKYGKKGFALAGIDYHALLAEYIAIGII